MESIQDIFGKTRVLNKKGKPKSERGELIRYFHERALDKNGKPYRASYIAYRLSHLTNEDLYSFKSMLEDRNKTKIGFNWQKTFWGMLKVPSN